MNRAVLALLLAVGTPAFGSPPPPDLSRFERAQSLLARRGGRLVAGPHVGFLVRGEQASHEVRLDAAGCYAAFVVAARQVVDVDLFVHAAEGIRLDEDVGPDAYPAVRICVSAAGVRVWAVVRMHQGAGEYVLGVSRVSAGTPIETASVLREEGQTAGPDPRTVAPQIGPTGQRGASLSEAQTSVEARLVSRGYARPPSWRRGRLAGGGEEDVPVALDTPGCFALAGAGESLVRDLDVVLYDGSGREIDRDDATDAEPVVRTCTPAAASGGALRYRARVRMYSGSGEFATALFRLRTDVPASLPAELRFGYAETVSLWTAQRFSLGAPVVRGAMAGPGIQSRIESFEAGACYVVAGVAQGAVDLDVSVYDAQGTIVGSDLGPENTATFRICPRRSDSYRIEYRLYGAAQYLSMLFESREARR